MMNEFMIQKAKELAAKAINYNAGMLVAMPADMYIVWFSKTLQNWKALVSTDTIHGIYIEVTHNGDEGETYCDVYKKQRNVCYKDGENR